MLTEINGNIDATYPIITGELTGYLGPIGTVTASADNSVGTPHVVVTQTPTPNGLDIDFAFEEMGIPGLDLTVEQDLTEEQQQTARENIDAQEVLTFDNVPTSGSSNPVTSAGIYAADEDLKDYVDDSINRSSAFFRGNFGTYAALMAVPWQTTDPDAPNFVSNNDYAAVADDETHSHESWRYIYVLEEGGQDNGWTAQYRINESPFTVEQLAAINSGITANDVTKLAGIEQGAQVNTVTGVKGDAEANYRIGNINITKANIGLGNVDNTSDLNKPVSTAQQAAIEAATKALYDVKSAGPAAIVSIHDAEAIPLKSLVAQITPVQDLHGYDNPWPAGGGKNKLAMTLDWIKAANGGTWTGNSVVLNGVTFTVVTDAGGNVTAITASGTAGPSNAILYVGEMASALTEDMILTGCPASGGNSSYRVTYNTIGSDVGSGVTIPSGTIAANVYIRIYQGYAISGTLTFYPMLRLSTESDATFAPYSNICPISGWTGANITHTGKNLFDKSMTFTENKVLNGSGGVDNNNAYSYSDYIRVEPNTDSVFSGTIVVNNAYNSVVYYDANKNFISRYQPSTRDVPAQFTTPNNCHFIRFNASSGAGKDVNTIQLEKGTIATAYEAFGGVLNIDWTSEAGTVYGGTLNVTTGVLTVTKRVPVDASTLSWTKYTYGCGADTDNAVAYTVMSSHYKSIDTGGWDENPDGGIMNIGNAMRINDVAHQPDKTTWENYLAAQTLAGTPVMITYDIATPQTYQLTPTEVKTLLGDNNIFCDTGDVQVTYETGTVAVALADLYEKLAAQIGA